MFESALATLSSVDAMTWLAPLQDVAAGSACLVFVEPAALAHPLRTRLKIPVTSFELVGPWGCLCLPCLQCNRRNWPG